MPSSLKRLNLIEHAQDRRHADGQQRGRGEMCQLRWKDALGAPFLRYRLPETARDASNTIWSYRHRRSKKLNARSSKSRSRGASWRIWARVRFPSMAPSRVSSKESRVKMRSVNVCDWLMSTATLPGGRRSRTHTVHGSAIGMYLRQESPANVIGWFSSAPSSRYAMKLCETIVPRKSSTAACCSGEDSAASRAAWGLRATAPHCAK